LIPAIELHFPDLHFPDLDFHNLDFANLDFPNEDSGARDILRPTAPLGGMIFSESRAQTFWEMSG